MGVKKIFTTPNLPRFYSDNDPDFQVIKVLHSHCKKEPSTSPSKDSLCSIEELRSPKRDKFIPDSFVPTTPEKPFTSSTTQKLLTRRFQDIRNINQFIANVKLKSEEPIGKLSTCNSTSGPKKDINLCPSPITKNKTTKNAILPKELGSKASDLILKDWPFTKQSLKEASLPLPEACNLFLTLTKSKRLELKLLEEQFDDCLTDLQKALTNAKIVSLKMENEPENVPEQLSVAKTQEQKLNYLLIVSYRTFTELDECGKMLSNCLPNYLKETKNFHSSLDNLLNYIMEVILEKKSKLT